MIVENEKRHNNREFFFQEILSYLFLIAENKERLEPEEIIFLLDLSRYCRINEEHFTISPIGEPRLDRLVQKVGYILGEELLGLLLEEEGIEPNEVYSLIRENSDDFLIRLSEECTVSRFTNSSMQEVVMIDFINDPLY